MTGNSTMRAYRRPSGRTGAEALELDCVSLPAPDAGEALVRVVCAGLNPVDFKSLSTGVDGAGVVTGCGLGCDEKWLGKRVLFHCDLTRPGTFSEFVTVRGAALAAMPGSLSFETAAQLPCPGGTAMDILQRLAPLGLRKRAPVVLVRAAAGAVGSLVLQLGNAAGWRMLASCSPVSFDFALGLGAEGALDRHASQSDEERDLAKLVHSGRVDGVVNLVDSASAAADFRLLAHRGVLVAVVGRPDLLREGGMHAAPDSAVVPPFALSPTLSEVALGAAYRSGDDRDIEELAALYAEVALLVASGSLKVAHPEVLEFENLARGLAAMQAGTARTKMVVRIGQS